jgi:hypothetical protein
MFNKKFSEAELVKFQEMIGKVVWKNHKTTSKTQPKPFKSGNKLNTVKGIVPHNITGYPSFTFLEDGSMVECFRCSIAPQDSSTII